MHNEMQEQTLLNAFQTYANFSKALLDAYALLTPHGKVAKCNPLLATMLGKSSKQITKEESLDQLLKFSVDEKSLSVLDILIGTTPTRIDEVAAVTWEDHSLNLILGYYPFISDGHIIGGFLLMRDVTAETNLQGKYKDKATQSITDKLTGLYNRAYFDAYLPKTIESLSKNRRNNESVCVVMADIDFFKKINDNFGHQAGDMVLEQVANLFKISLRKTDVMCRYGGEEFLGIFLSTHLQGAFEAAEKVRKAIEAHVFMYNGARVPVTISMGISEVQLGTEDSAGAIARADVALYFSKQNGRNRVSRHHGDDGKIT